MSNSDTPKLAIFLTVIWLFIALMAWNHGYRTGECEARGGIFAKHQFVMKCIIQKEKPNENV